MERTTNEGPEDPTDCDGIGQGPEIEEEGEKSSTGSESTCELSPSNNKIHRGEVEGENECEEEEHGDGKDSESTRESVDSGDGAGLVFIERGREGKDPKLQTPSQCG
eukprot:2155015-Rhodomonas_salina.1